MTLISYIYAIGALQGFILAVALFLKKTNFRSNRILATWILILVFDLLMKVIYFNNPNTLWLHGYILAVFLPFLYGSFFYLYVRSITRKQRIVWLDLIHFIGFIYMVGVNLPWITNPWDNGPKSFVSFDLLLYLYSVSYVIAGLVSIRRYRQDLEQQQSNTDGISLVWIDLMAYFLS